jgi:predicted DNA-binding transcriptional regulator YafY
VDPLGLVAKGGAWYLVAGTPDGYRTYRVSRIEEARLLDQPSQRPPRFDLAAHWKSSTEDLRKEWGKYEATLRLEPGAAESMRTWRTTSPVEAAEPSGSADWVTLRARFEDEGQATFVCLGLGPRVDVIAPARLRDRVAADLAAALKRIEGGALSAPPPGARSASRR